MGKIEKLILIYKKSHTIKVYREKMAPYMRKTPARFSFSSTVAVSKTNLIKPLSDRGTADKMAEQN